MPVQQVISQRLATFAPTSGIDSFSSQTYSPIDFTPDRTQTPGFNFPDRRLAAPGIGYRSRLSGVVPQQGQQE